MNKKAAVDNGLEELSVLLDPREQGTDIPMLLQVEFLLEDFKTARPKGQPKKSRHRLEVYRSMRSFGLQVKAPIKLIAAGAQVSVRAAQYAVQDLAFLGWGRKSEDVSKRGGLVAKTKEGGVHEGNHWSLTRPQWAWNGKHLAHFAQMVAGGRGAQGASLPLVQQITDALLKQGRNHKPWGSTVFENSAPRERGARALHPSGGAQRSETAKKPKSLILRDIEREGLKGKQTVTAKGKGSPSLSPTAGEPKSKSAQRWSWPNLAEPFLALYKARHGFRPEATEKTVTAFKETQQLCGIHHLQAYKTYLARPDAFLRETKHPWGTFRRQWEMNMPDARQTTRESRPQSPAPGTRPMEQMTAEQIKALPPQLRRLLEGTSV